MVIALLIGAAIVAAAVFLFWCCIEMGRGERAELP